MQRQRPIAMLTPCRYGPQYFGGKRVGEQALKGLHLSPSAPLCRLHATRLEPTHNRMGVVPVDGMPVHLLRETAPAGVATTAVIGFVSCIGSPCSRVMQDPRGKSAHLRGE